jgi:hypothetical protein
MTTAVENQPNPTTTEADLVTALQEVLRASEEPLTLPKIRSLLPAGLRKDASLEVLAESLRRQEAANVVYQFPKYRSSQDRYWDRPMPVHVANLVQTTLAESPLPFSELRRKLPAYAQSLAESVVEQQLAAGRLHRHPRLAGRNSERLGVNPPDPKDYLRGELQGVFQRLSLMGFEQQKLREAAIELLHEEEWATQPLAESKPAQAVTRLPELGSEEPEGQGALETAGPETAS